MPRADNRYSQFVTAAKIILPLAGLGLLSSLFLISGAPESDLEIPITDVELEEIVEGQRILMPRYQTVLDNGSELALAAQSARPDLRNLDQFLANEVTGTLSQPDGVQIDLRGAKAVIDNAARTVRIEGGLRLARTDGFTLSARSAEAQLDGQAAEVTSDLVVVGPGITLSAGGASIAQDPATDTQRVVFTQGVKLVYTPQ